MKLGIFTVKSSHIIYQKNLFKSHIWSPKGQSGLKKNFDTQVDRLTTQSCLGSQRSDFFFRMSPNHIFGSLKAYFCIGKNFQLDSRSVDDSRIPQVIAGWFLKKSPNRIFGCQNANLGQKILSQLYSAVFLEVLDTTKSGRKARGRAYSLRVLTSTRVILLIFGNVRLSVCPSQGFAVLNVNHKRDFGVVELCFG